MTTELESRSMQIWPGGKQVHYRRDGNKIEVKDGEAYRLATDDELREIRVEELAEQYQRHEVYCCDSSLVDDALRLDGEGELGREFSIDNVTGLYPDPSDWDLEQCKEWLEDHGHDLPDPNPWEMDRAALIEAAHPDYEDADEDDKTIIDAATDDAIRNKLIENIGDETTDGLDDWRDAVRDNAEAEEIYEWWRVSEWLAKRLIEVGEPVMDNAYGYWWGRGCTGQGFIMDGTLQKVAADILNRHPEW